MTRAASGRQKGEGGLREKKPQGYPASSGTCGSRYARGAENADQSENKGTWLHSQVQTEGLIGSRAGTTAQRWSGQDPGEPGRSRPTGRVHELETPPPFSRPPSIPVVPSQRPRTSPANPGSSVPIGALVRPVHWRPRARASVFHFHLKSKLINHIRTRKTGLYGICLFNWIPGCLLGLRRGSPCRMRLRTWDGFLSKLAGLHAW
jgi:hypothetical protein